MPLPALIRLGLESGLKGSSHDDHRKQGKPLRSLFRNGNGAPSAGCSFRASNKADAGLPEMQGDRPEAKGDLSLKRSPRRTALIGAPDKSNGPSAGKR